MRSLSLRANVLLTCLAAAALVATLGRPWYDAAPGASADGETPIGALPGTMEGFFSGLARSFGASSGTSGWAALSTADTLLAGVAALVAACALASLAAALQDAVRPMLQIAALAALGIVVVKLFDQPGENAAVELRHGALLALASAAALLSCAAGVTTAPVRRRHVTRTYQPPPPPQFESAASAPPPGK
jgi:hypothetical protein